MWVPRLEDVHEVMPLTINFEAEAKILIAESNLCRHSQLRIFNAFTYEYLTAQEKDNLWY